MDERSTNRLQRQLKTRTPNLHRAKEKAQFECGWKGGDSSGTNQALEGHKVQAEIQDTNWRLSRLTFLPSWRIAEPSSPSRVRCAAPKPGAPLTAPGGSAKSLSQEERLVSERQRQKQTRLKFYLTSTGILMEGICTQNPTRGDSERYYAKLIRACAPTASLIYE
jgi:hypothetical protein